MLISPHDRQILRGLAFQVAKIADLPVMEERRALWKCHNDLHGARPMLLIFPEGAWQELLPESCIECESDNARGMEYGLRQQIYTYQHFQSDNVVEKEWIVQKAIHSTGWGLSASHKARTQERGSWAFDPVILSAADLKKMHFPEISHDEKATQDRLSQAQDLFGDILDVKLKGIAHISFHLMAIYTELRGLEQVMYDMVEEPQMLHDAMSFLEEGHHQMVRQYDQLNLFSLNNDNTYHSSGGVGYTDELPRSGWDPDHIRPCDMWSSAEAQEMAQVSPEMHEEFILNYERRLLAPFGLNGYGCCEDLTHKLPQVFTLPNIRRISISPFANVDSCAQQIGKRCIFSWKPQPAHLVGEFDADMVRRYIAHTLNIAKDCHLEIILKDTHTCQNHPERFDEWCQITRDLIAQSSG